MSVFTILSTKRTPFSLFYYFFNNFKLRKEFQNKTTNGESPSLFVQGDVSLKIDNFVLSYVKIELFMREHPSIKNKIFVTSIKVKLFVRGNMNFKIGIFVLSLVRVELFVR